MNIGNTGFSNLPEVVKNLMIINGLFFLGTLSLGSYGIDMYKLFSLHQFQSPDFMPHQLISHIFMHGNFTHLLFNMFSLWMFGRILENMWGAKRFLVYYLITGLGAALIYIGYIQFQIYNITSLLDVELVNQVLNASANSEIFAKPADILSMQNLWGLINSPMLGASGAVYGLLLAFGMLFPNSKLHIFSLITVVILFDLIFKIRLPFLNIYWMFILIIISQFSNEIRNIVFHTIPIKAKYFVMGLGAIALFSGISNNPTDNIAHFAHLGGMIFGFLLLIYWKKKGDIYF